MAVAEALEREGARVWRLDRQAGPGAHAGTIRCDVTSDDSVSDARRMVLRETPVIHHIYNGAGILPARGGVALHQEEVAEWQDVMDTNLYGTLRILKAFGEALDSGGGASVVNMSSDQSLSPNGSGLSYPASKAAVNALTVGLAKQWAERLIRVNAVAPGPVRTGFIDVVAGSTERREAMFDHADRVLPFGIAEPATTAALVLFLLSDDARHVTGEVWRSDSGQALLGIRL